MELLLPNGALVPVGQRLGFPIPAAPTIAIGRGYRDERGRLIQKPMSFGAKNMISLRELQDSLIGVMRPDLTTAPTAWTIRHRPFLVTTLGLLPSDLYPMHAVRGGALDIQNKPLAVAIQGALPNLDVQVYGKGGRAYGFAVENAFVTSPKTGRSFFVATTVYANGNETMNDDRYEYDEVAAPFIARLGVVLAQHLLLPSTSAAVSEGNDEHR